VVTVVSVVDLTDFLEIGVGLKEEENEHTSKCCATCGIRNRIHS
jgi:hypothetical protein